MAKTNKQDSSTAVEETAVSTAPSAALVANPYGIALPPTNFADKVDPEEDVVVPWLYFKHGQSKYEAGDVGDIVLSQGEEKLALFGPGVKVPCVVVFVDKFWEEQIPWKDRQRLKEKGGRPERAYTLEASRELKAASKYRITPICTALVLLEHTADSLIQDETEVAFAFPFLLDGKHYAAGKFEAKYQGYDGTAKKIQRWLSANPGKDYLLANWNLQSAGQANRDGDEWHTPELFPTAGIPGPEVVDFAAKTRAVYQENQARRIARQNEKEDADE